jgi:hypothetical protein
LGFIFDDSDFNVEYVSVINKSSESVDLHLSGIVLYDSNDNALIIDKNYPTFPLCPPIKTMRHLKKYSDIYNVAESDDVCNEAINEFKNGKIEITNNNGLTIIKKEVAIEGFIFSATFRESFSAMLLVFADNNFIGFLHYVSPNKDKNRLLRIIKTIKPHKEFKPIDQYIEAAKKSIEAMKINFAFKNVASAMLLDINNKEALALLKEMHGIKRLYALFIEDSIKKMENAKESRILLPPEKGN